LRYLGTQSELDSYLSSLVTLETLVLKPAIPLEISPVLPAQEKPAVAVSGADFSNGTGMRMVSLPGGWWASKYETTQAQYAQVTNGNPSLFKDPSRPVDSVSWNEAVEFCNKLTASESKAGRLPVGFIYRLPTVQEFDSFTADASLGNAVTSNAKVRWHTAPVGTLGPNKLGLHDVIGNVWEWCLDWGDHAHRLKTSKGGSWTSIAEELSVFTGSRKNLGCIESAYIDRRQGPVRKDAPDQRFWDRGFRPVLAPASN
jgi:formylglycine-generating enzyme required for sulfatase activity